MTPRKIKKAYSILDDYNGQNPYVSMLSIQYKRGGKVLNDFEVEYINKNHDYETIVVNKVVKISRELGQKLYEKNNFAFVPEKVKVLKIIGEMGDSYHAYILYRQSEGPTLVYLQKKGILDRLFTVDWRNTEIDFSKYDDHTSKLEDKPFTLAEHQKDGVKFLVSNKKCICADEMGCGKTITSIVAALESKAEHVLIICPASLKHNWKRECLRYCNPEDVDVIYGSKWKENVGKFTIINFEIVQKFYEVAEEPVFEDVEIKDSEGNVVETLKKPVMVKNSSGKLVQKMKKSMKKEDIKRCLLKSPLFLNDFDCVIIDEAQKLSNNTSIRYKTIYDFLKKANPRYIFLLTGTPLTNTPLNLYHILKLISCDVTSDYSYYITHYCGAIKHNKRDGGHYYTFGEISNLDELREKIKDNYIRRLTSDVGTMVRKNVEMRYFDLDYEQKERYKKLWSDYVKAQEGYQVTIESYYDDYWDEYTEESDLDKNRKLIEGSLIRQFFGREMVQHTIDTVNELLEDGEKVVIMTVFKEELRRFKEYYGDKAVIFRGGMTPKQKEKAENAFNNDKNVKVFIGQIIAAGVGLNLDSASYLIFNNYDWVAANNIQAESRIHRLTQKKDVTCIYMLFDESISEEMFNKVIYKEMLMNETIKSENQKNLKL